MKVAFSLLLLSALFFGAVLAAPPPKEEAKVVEIYMQKKLYTNYDIGFYMWINDDEFMINNSALILMWVIVFMEPYTLKVTA